MIKDNLKKKLERLKGVWVDELPMVLWAHRTTSKEATEETPFSLMFVTEAVIPVEVGLSSYRVENYAEQDNGVALLENLDFLDKKCDQVAIRMAAQKQLVAMYYNSRVRPQLFLSGDLVLRKVFQNTQKKISSNFSAFIYLLVQKSFGTRLAPHMCIILLALKNGRRAGSNPYEEPVGPTTASGHI